MSIGEGIFYGAVLYVFGPLVALLAIIALIFLGCGVSVLIDRWKRRRGAKRHV